MTKANWEPNDLECRCRYGKVKIGQEWFETWNRSDCEFHKGLFKQSWKLTTRRANEVRARRALEQEEDNA